jgi:hypothetical protein
LFSEDGNGGVSISLLSPHEDFSDGRTFVAMNSFKLSIIVSAFGSSSSFFLGRGGGKGSICSGSPPVGLGAESAIERNCRKLSLPTLSSPSPVGGINCTKGLSSPSLELLSPKKFAKEPSSPPTLFCPNGELGGDNSLPRDPPISLR